MFSFHKPKIYRSHLGCCICKAKSSSSRFTDSNKYENEFEQCFRLQEKRSGEICNACVLLVKRWKKLSPESRLNKHWHHVVDARAGPGTGKLTGNKRLTIGSSSSSSANNNNNQSVGHHDSNSSNQTNRQQQQQSRKSEILPLSSSSQANSSGAAGTNNIHRTRISNKARAIDTNVSHFTFGEPYYNRRNHMMNEQQANCYSSASGSSALTKPQSALNSSAFESVIKRFRQRQQQQQLDAKRREMNRQQRQQRSIKGNSNGPAKQIELNLEKQQQQQQQSSSGDNVESSNEQQQQQQQPQQQQQATATVKRFKRSSIEGSTVAGSAASASPSQSNADMMRISTLLDGSIWRKEKICCGYIFRGPYDELAIFPKLLKPCKCRDSGSQEKEDEDEMEMEDEEVEEGEEDDDEEEDELLIKDGQQPPSRATKSGSISSCDSNTSGTGSMEQPLDEIQSIKRAIAVTADQRLESVSSSETKPKKKTPTMTSGKPGRQVGGQTVAGKYKRRQQLQSRLNNDNDTSSSSSSSSRLMIHGTEEYEEEDNDEEEEAEDRLILDEDEVCESSNDASASSIESLANDKEQLKQVATS